MIKTWAVFNGLLVISYHFLRHIPALGFVDLFAIFSDRNFDTTQPILSTLPLRVKVWIALFSFLCCSHYLKY